MTLFQNKTVKTASLYTLLTCIMLAILPGCENKPVVNEAMDEDGKPAVEQDAIKTTNIKEDVDAVNADDAKLPGMPEDTDEVLPGAQ